MTHTLHDIYVQELKDLWSANDQMVGALARLAERASDRRLRSMLAASLFGIAQHTDTIQKLVAQAGADVAHAHSQGMDGLARDALRQVLDPALAPGAVVDVLVIAHYQRMSHYGIAGFGTAAAYAMALGLDRDHETLGLATRDIYQSDEWMNKLAERSVNIKASAALDAG